MEELRARGAQVESGAALQAQYVAVRAGIVSAFNSNGSNLVVGQKWRTLAQHATETRFLRYDEGTGALGSTMPQLIRRKGAPGDEQYATFALAPQGSTISYSGQDDFYKDTVGLYNLRLDGGWAIIRDGTTYHLFLVGAETDSESGVMVSYSMYVLE